MDYRTPSPRYEAYQRNIERWSERRSSHRPKKWVGKIILILLALLGLFGIYEYTSVVSIGDTYVEAGTYTIEKWATLSTLPKSLDIEVDEFKYKLWTRFFAPSINLQAGTYKLDDMMPLSQVLSETLKSPLYSDLTITILPGWNMYDIDSYLSDKGILEAWELLLAARDHFTDLQKKYIFLADKTNLEWFLYPDTYRIAQSSDAYMIIDKLLSEWQKKIWESYTKRWSSAYNELILASIVEREERNKSEQPTVAGILAKRVQEGIAMWADATVCVGYAKTQKQCTPSFIASVITENNPYNTRSKLWYPPTPISNLSLDTWNNTINREGSPYYYYLHGSDGVIHYGRTLSEHNANKSAYLK
jgi:UPF0755 protein